MTSEYAANVLDLESLIKMGDDDVLSKTRSRFSARSVVYSPKLVSRPQSGDE